MAIARGRTFAAGVVVACFACCLAFGQKGGKQDSTVREVEGTVTDASGSPIEKAVVQLKDTKTLQVQSFITDSAGHYHFAGLNTDVEYQLKAEHNAESTGWKTLSLFNTKKVATINFKLKSK